MNGKAGEIFCSRNLAPSLFSYSGSYSYCSRELPQIVNMKSLSFYLLLIYITIITITGSTTILLTTPMEQQQSSSNQSFWAAGDSSQRQQWPNQIQLSAPVSNQWPLTVPGQQQQRLVVLPPPPPPPPPNVVLLAQGPQQQQQVTLVPSTVLRLPPQYVTLGEVLHVSEGPGGAEEDWAMRACGLLPPLK
jgi:hypothetical protein